MKKISRQKFLQISSLGFASLAFPTPFWGNSLEKIKYKKYDIVILGSSLDALITTQKLNEKGCNNILLLDVFENQNISIHSSPILVSENEAATLLWLEKQQIPYFQLNNTRKTIGKIDLEVSEKADIESTALVLLKMAKNVNWQALQHDKKAAIYDKMLLSDFLENRLQTLTAHALFAHKIDEIFGCQTDEISLLYYLHFLEKNLAFDIINNDNQHFIVDEKLLNISEKLKKHFSEKTFFTQEIESITHSESEFFIHTTNEKITASQIIVAVNFLNNKEKCFKVISNISFEQKKLVKTSFCIKISYAKAFWREQDKNGHIISFSGLLSKVFDISLPHEKYASLLIYPDKNYFSQLSESESKALVIDELTDFFDERALSYIKYEKHQNHYQMEDIGQSFLKKNTLEPIFNNIFWLEKMPIINNELSRNIQAADAVIEMLLQKKIVL